MFIIGQSLLHNEEYTTMGGLTAFIGNISMYFIGKELQKVNNKLGS
jgi:hypothetical protein